jgi:hypothetical protein
MSELNSHWTDDEDLLAGFVLNRVGAEERQRLEAHLRSCEQCRRAVEAERLLAAGVKKAGREELKERLKKKLVPSKKFVVTWYQVVGAAATIVVLISIGIYSHWFSPGGAEEGPMAVRRETNKLEIPENRTKAGEKDKGVTTSPSQGARAQPPREAEREHAIAVPSVPVETEAKGAIQPKVAPLQVTAAQAPKSAEALKKQVSGETAVWVQGVILSNEAETRGEVQLYAPLAEKKLDELRLQKAEPTGVTGRKRVALLGGKEIGEVAVAQEPVSNLPASHQARQEEPDRIETLLQRTGGKLVLTLYLDTLVSGPELRNARIELLSEDSIIVNMGGRRIGYKLPSGWAGEQRTQTRKKR